MKIMNSAKRFQFFIISALQADAQAVDPDPFPAAQFVLRYRPGIRFYRDFRGFTNMKS